MKSPADNAAALTKRDGGLVNPEVGNADNTTGVLLGPLTAGRWALTSSQDVYWLRGASTLVPGTSVLVDETTPSTSNPLRGGEVHEIIVDQGDATYNYVGFRTNAGTALVHAIPIGDFSRQ